MSVTLRDEDRQAVDLLLDHAPTAQHGVAISASGSVCSERVSAVEKILTLLESMPPAEPGSDLLAKTLARVNGKSSTPIHGHDSSLIDESRPHA